MKGRLTAVSLIVAIDVAVVYLVYTLIVAFMNQS